ncbi:MAG: hypothetical protein JO112_00870 [Planctomycetes bacterium]|nr:hypothetical protein [Planctomycetota bacterium]
MAEFDHSMKIITDSSGRELARLAGVNCQRLRPVESTVARTTELLADRAFRATWRRERFVLYFEFYTRWDRNAPWDMLAKSGFLSQREHLPTVCLAFILLPRGYRSHNGQMRLTAAGGPTQHLWFREIPLWEQDPQPWWEEVPGLMALYPLCRHRQRPHDAIQHAVGVIEAHTPDTPARADFLAYLNTFGQLAFPRVDVETIIGSEKMKESPFLRKVMNIGRIEEKRTDILIILKRRFGDEAAGALAPQLDECTDLKRLKQLLELALDCATLQEFRNALP